MDSSPLPSPEDPEDVPQEAAFAPPRRAAVPAWDKLVAAIDKMEPRREGRSYSGAQRHLFFVATAEPPLRSELVGVARRSGSADPEDSVQDVILKLLPKVDQPPETFNSGADARNWMYECVRNAVRDQLRRKANQPHQELPDEIAGDDRTWLQRLAYTPEDVHRGLARLRGRHHAEVLRMLMQEMTAEEIATRLGLKAATVRKIKERASISLRSILESE